MRGSDYTGKTKGRLTAIKKDPTKLSHWICKCECGTLKSLRFSGTSAKSCGCLHSPVDEIYHKELKIRIENRVSIDENGCWNWILRIEKAGYGLATYRKRTIRAHVLSWISYKGEVPKGLQVCHTCDNRKCVNPDHLFLGTLQENKQDMMKKNRQAKGSKVGTSKLHEDDIREIHRLYESGEMSQREIAVKYNKRFQKINCIIRGRSWKHVKPFYMEETEKTEE